MTKEQQAIIDAAVRLVNFPSADDIKNRPKDADKDVWFSHHETENYNALVAAVRDAGLIKPSSF